jgi:hypothetical protein
MKWAGVVDDVEVVEVVEVDVGETATVSAGF